MKKREKKLSIFTKGYLLKSLLLTSIVFLFSCGTNEQEDSPVDSEPENVITWTECSQQIDDHPCNFTTTDQFGNKFELYEHYGKVIVLDFSTMWCSVCQSIGDHAQTYQDSYDSQNFIWVTVLIEDYAGDTVDQNDLVIWAEQYGITSALVLKGDRDMIDHSAVDGYPITAWPTIVIINREMILSYGLIGWSESTIIEKIEETL